MAAQRCNDGLYHYSKDERAWGPDLCELAHSERIANYLMDLDWSQCVDMTLDGAISPDLSMFPKSMRERPVGGRLLVLPPNELSDSLAETDPMLDIVPSRHDDIQARGA